MTSTTRDTTTRKKALRAATIGVAGVGLTVAAAGVATAAAPGSSVGHAVHGAVRAVGIGAGTSPDGYTQEQYDAFWAAGFTGEDLTRLEAIWNLDETQTKARAGQALIDHRDLPFAPGTNTAPTPAADEEAEYQAAIDAGYTSEDIAELEALWHTDYLPTKAHVGELLLAGQDVPVKPSGEDEVHPELTPQQQAAAAAKSGR